MVEQIVIYLAYLTFVAQLIAMTAVVYLAYRIVKLVGAFWAWILITGGFSIISSRALLILLTLTPAQLVVILETAPTSFWPAQLTLVVGSVMILAGIYKLARTFERQLRKS